MNPGQLELRDYHLPDPVAWWPPAPGWWILAAMLAAGAILAVILLVRRRRSARRAALLILQDIERGWREDGDSQRLLQSLSSHLRRIALTCMPREQVAGLSDRQWLAFLDSTLGRAGRQRPFENGPGQALAEAPYTPHPEVDGDALLRLSESWIRAITAVRRPRARSTT